MKIIKPAAALTAALVTLSLFCANVSAEYAVTPIEECIEYLNNMGNTGSRILNAKELEMIKRVIRFDREFGGNLSALPLVSSVQLDRTEIKMNVDEPVAPLKATLFPEDCRGGRITWRSGNPDVVTVDSNGQLKAISPGAAVVTAQTEAGCFDMCRVVVRAPYPESFVIQQSEYSVEEGTEMSIEALFSPCDIINTTVQWYSDNDDTALITDYGYADDGIITENCKAVISSGEMNVNVKRTQTKCRLSIKTNKPGTASITAVAANGKKVVCTINVIPGDKGVSFDKNEYAVFVGSSFTLSAVVNPENAFDPTVVYESEDPSIASVTSDGIVTGIREGETYITVTSVHGHTDRCLVRVRPPASSVELSLKEISLNAGDTYPLIATVYPITTVDKTVIWSSSDKNVIRVDEDGLVTAVGPGEAKVIAAISTGVYAECTVKVNPKVYADNILLSVNDNNSVLEVGEEYQLIWQVSPKETNQGFELIAANDCIAVTPEGVITALKKGRTSVTARAEDGLSVTLDFEVKDKDEFSYIHVPGTMYIRVGETQRALVSVYPETLTPAFLTFDTEGIEVTEDGVITALTAGRYKVEVTAGELSESLYVQVCEPEDYTVSTLYMPALKYYKGVGDIFNIEPVTDLSSPYIGMNWLSSAPGVCSVSDKGEVTCLQPGTAEITCLCGNIERVCTVYVGREAKKYTNTDITLDMDANIIMSKGEVLELKYTVTPKTEEENICIATTDPGIVKVYNGKLYAKAAGKAVITVKHKSGTAAYIGVEVW